MSTEILDRLVEALSLNWFCIVALHGCLKKNSRHPLIQLGVKPKPIANSSHRVSIALRQKLSLYLRWVLITSLDYLCPLILVGVITLVLVFPAHNWNAIKRYTFSYYYIIDLSQTTTGTTHQQTSRSPDVSSKLSVPSVPSTLSLTSSKAPEKDDVTTKEPESLYLYGHDIDSKWKIAFGVCLALIIILLAGAFLG